MTLSRILFGEPKSFSGRVWDGDPKTVAEARQLYYLDPSEENLIRLANALYSKRGRERFAEELAGLEKELLTCGKALLRKPFPGTQKEQQKDADRADAVSSYLLWLSRRQEIEDSDREVLFKTAEELADKYLNLLREHHLHHEHTWYLLKLTSMRMMARGNPHGALYELQCLGSKLEHAQITDPMQRSRVYRNYGFLCCKYAAHARPVSVGSTHGWDDAAWFRKKGWQWGIRAIAVPGVPRAVRLKAAVALAGIER